MVQGGHYVISGATSPRYFLQNEGQDLITRNQAELEVSIFAKHIVPVLGITRRYVGTEPYSPATLTYNAAMKRILKSCDVEVIEVERKADGTDAEGDPNHISATKIRKAIREGSLDSVRTFLPPSTLAYLQSGLSRAVRAKLKAWPE